jgi:hypothetical protein
MVYARLSEDLMPTSAWQTISPILNEVAALHTGPRPIRAVLDVGCGGGKWGMLLRDNLDFLHNAAHSPADWRVRIDGVEALERYRSPVHEYLYDKIFWMDVLDALPRLGHYDVIVAMEVMEQIEKPAALRLVSALRERCRLLIVGFTPTGLWKEAELAAFDARKIADRTWVIPGLSAGATEADVEAALAPRRARIAEAQAERASRPSKYAIADAVDRALKRVPGLYPLLRTAARTSAFRWR